MKNLYIIIILVFLLISTSCGGNNQRLVVTDVQKPQVITLHKKPNQKYIYGMSIRGSGKLNGKAKIDLMLNGKPYHTAQIDGKVSFNWGGDWYSDSIELRYQPENINSGTVVIEYSFFD